MADDKKRNEDVEVEVEGHLKTRGVEENRPLEPEDKVKAGKAGRASLNEEPEVEGHVLKAANPEKKYKKG